VNTSVTRYVSALLIAGAAVAARFAVDPWFNQRLPFIAFFPAVAVTVLLIGPGPAVLVAALGLVAANYFFLDPTLRLDFDDPSTVSAQAVYLVACALIIGAGVISRRRQAVTAGSLKTAVESEANFRHMADSAPMLIWVSDEKRKGTYFNKRWLEFTGRTLEHELGDGWLESVHTDDLGALEGLKQEVGRENTFATEFRLRSAHGEYRWMHYSGAPLLDSKGRFSGFVGSCVDITDRKEIDASRAWLAAVVSASSDAIISKTLDGIILSWNQGAERIFGYTAAEAVGRSIDLIIPPELRDEERQILARLRRGERIEHFETVRLCKDGRRIDIGLTISPIRDDTGRIVGASKTAHDITEEKLAVAALTESEARYRAVVESQSEMLFRFQSDGTILFANSAYARMLGADQSVLLGKNFWDFIPDEEQPRFRALLARLTSALPELRLENQLETVDGVRWILWTIRALLFDAEGDVLEAQATGIDITDRKRAEKALSDSEQRFVQFMHHLPGLAWIKDIHGRYIYANEAAAQAFNKSRDSLVGKTDADLFDTATAGQFRDNDLRALATPEGVQTIETLPHHDGVVHHSIVSKFAIPSAGDRPTLIGGVAIDITERKRAEEALRETGRRKDQFLAVLGHELRNPLAPLRNGIELLKEWWSGEPRAERVLEMMDRQLMHLLRLVDDLLDVSRIGRGKADLKMARIDLRDVIGAGVEQAQTLIAERKHSLNVQQSALPLAVTGDLERLIQVVANLLTNAATYTQEGGRIDLRTEVAGGDAVVCVADTGLGIAPEHLDTVFEPFAQVAEQSSQAGARGLGIGLALSREIVRMHCGRIEARSAGLGRGSEFRVSLPLAQAIPAAQEAEPPARLRAPTRGRRILVVDDNVDAAESLQRILEIYGHNVYAVSDGHAALEAIDAFRPTVVLLDIGLPGLDGYEVARRIRAMPHGRKICLCAITGWGQAEDKRRAREAGFDEHMTKPVDLGALTALIAREGAALPSTQEL
jgi:PAS domain S-box-containing protein